MHFQARHYKCDQHLFVLSFSEVYDQIMVHSIFMTKDDGLPIIS